MRNQIGRCSWVVPFQLKKVPSGESIGGTKALLTQLLLLLGSPPQRRSGQRPTGDPLSPFATLDIARIQGCQQRKVGRASDPPGGRVPISGAPFVNASRCASTTRSSTPRSASR